CVLRSTEACAPPIGGIVPQAPLRRPQTRRCAGRCPESVPATLRHRRWYGLIIRKEKSDGSRHGNVLGCTRLHPGARTPHHHVWWEYVVCERGLWRARHHL